MFYTNFYMNFLVGLFLINLKIVYIYLGSFQEWIQYEEFGDLEEIGKALQLFMDYSSFINVYFVTLCHLTHMFWAPNFLLILLTHL